jgi:hypothetical protein
MPNMPPPPPGVAPPAVKATTKSTKAFAVSTGVVKSPQKFVIYGPGGVGKTELCSLMEQVGIKPLFLDLEDGTKFLDVARIGDIGTWEDLRGVVQNDTLTKDYGVLVIDSFSKAQELASDWVVQNVPHEKGSGHKTITSIEDYGYGKGLTHIYDACLLLLADLDAAIRRGLHVALVAHECITEVPNPEGENWIRYEPRLQSPPKGQNSVRHRVKEWCDHLLYVGFDTHVKDKKATGSGTRSICPNEMPSYWAKSRSLSNVIAYEKSNPELWKQVFQKGN